MKLTKKIIAVFLTMLTLFSICSVAMPVFAEYEWKIDVDIVDESYVQEEMTSKIVGEVNELRDEYEKHFICDLELTQKTKSIKMEIKCFYQINSFKIN